MPGMAWTPSTISSLLSSSLVMSLVYRLSPACGSGEVAVKAICPPRIMRALAGASLLPECRLRGTGDGDGLVPEGCYATRNGLQALPRARIMSPPCPT